MSAFILKDAMRDAESHSFSRVSAGHDGGVVLLCVSFSFIAERKDTRRDGETALKPD
ncbi:MAG: hypothetical protein AAF410_00175 [Pseudomonadota bacterium]